MTEEKAMVPVGEQTVLFYEDEITVVVVSADGAEQLVYVPLRPICEYLGIDWSSQRRRITNDPVLSRRARSVAVTATEAGGRREMTCLPLDFLNGWLFGVSTNRIKDDNIRERLIRYQDECYSVLAKAFPYRQTAPSPTVSTLVQVREMGRAIMQMAEEQIEFERRLTVTETRMNKAASIVGDLTIRVSSMEQRLTPGESVTEDQASQISQAVKTVAMALSKASGTNQYGAVYGELYRKFGITSYKLLPANRFEGAMKFLTSWHQDLVGDDPF
jgi:hypothetical protein